MAATLTLTASASYSDGTTTDATPTLSFAATLAATLLKQTKVSVAITEQAIPLSGSTGLLAYAVIVNRDATNYVEVRVGTGGSKFARLQPSGGFCILQLGTDATAPFIIANTAPCICDIYLFGP